MDRRMFDMSDFFRDTAFIKQDENNAIHKDCYDSNFCVKTPPQINNGILTMAFVDMQPINTVYEIEEGYDKGGIFPNINKPFYGGNLKWESEKC